MASRCRAQALGAQASVVVTRGLQQLWHTDLVAPQDVGSSWTRAQTHVPCVGRWILNHCATREAPLYSFFRCYVLHLANVFCLPPLVTCLAKDTDIVDEAIYYFKANVFFKNYEIKVKYRAFTLFFFFFNFSWSIGDLQCCIELLLFNLVF